jgi:hypothetical protein
MRTVIQHGLMITSSARPYMPCNGQARERHRVSENWLDYFWPKKTRIFHDMHPCSRCSLMTTNYNDGGRTGFTLPSAIRQLLPNFEFLGFVEDDGIV